MMCVARFFPVVKIFYSQTVKLWFYYIRAYYTHLSCRYPKMINEIAFYPIGDYTFKIFSITSDVCKKINKKISTLHARKNFKIQKLKPTKNWNRRNIKHKDNINLINNFNSSEPLLLFKWTSFLVLSHFCHLTLFSRE